MTTTEPEIAVRYEGPGTGSELWGMSQANFLVDLPRRHSKEIAVLLNDAASHVLAQQLATDDTPEFRAGAARYGGEYLIRKLAASGRHLDSSLVLSLSTLEEHSDILAHLKRIAS
jgi:hypothetical protein